jgi:hypothetical protein
VGRSYDCTTEFRLYWLQTKLAELAAEPPAPPQVRRSTRCHADANTRILTHS